MKTIIFEWSNTTHTGVITSEGFNPMLGKKTTISITHMDNKPIRAGMMTFTIYGKCEVGYCGPYNVIAIKNQK
jgi:hypothetical protein